MPKAQLSKLKQTTGMSAERLKHYVEMHKMPLGEDYRKLLAAVGGSDLSLRTLIGLPTTVGVPGNHKAKKTSKPAFSTKFGDLYRGDCLEVLNTLPSESVDLVFADPPFNLDKFYASKINDKLDERDYLAWCKEWSLECARVLKFGGSMFLWNLPKWNLLLGAFLSDYLTFRHWVAVDIKYRLPISGRLYPSHYSLIYLCKGNAPARFHPDRLPMEVCSDCKSDLRDYGGYKDRMNPLGVNLTDVWYDISPVRHRKYKKRAEANELPLKLMDRVIEMASNEGDVVLDPFGGSGTTFVASELKNRKWIGIEIGPIGGIENRFEAIDEDRQHLKRIRKDVNSLFTSETLEIRKRRGLWTPESVRKSR